MDGYEYEQAVKQIVEQILEKLPNEAEDLDYKVDSYTHKGETFLPQKKYSLLKDVLSMANAKNAPSEYRFIIIGISDDRQYVGVDSSKCADGSTYDELFKKIKPHLSVLPRQVIFGEKTYEYFCIHPEKYRIYRLADSCDFDPKRELVNHAFTRQGTSNREMSEEEILSIHRMALYDEAKINEQQKALITAQTVLAEAAIIGSWNEKQEEDCRAIEQIIGTSYSEWIDILREELVSNSSISFMDGRWKVSEREGILERYGDHIFDDEMNRIKETIIQVLTKPNSKYDEEPDKRWMSTVIGAYSSEMMEGLSRFLAIIGNRNGLFSRCDDSFETTFTREVLESVFNTNDWKGLATIGRNIQFLAESNPTGFLNEVEKCVKTENSALWQLFKEGEDIWGSGAYGQEFIRAIKILATDTRLFSQACVILFRIGSQREDALRVLEQILLPWYPQTHANAKKRKSIFKKLRKIDFNLAWELLYKLLPIRFSSAHQIEYPIYLKYKPVPQPDASEYEDVYETYENKAITMAAGDVYKIGKLIDCSIRLRENSFKQMVQLINDEAVKEHSLKDRYVVWNKLLTYTWQLRRSASDCSDREHILRECIEKWKPVSLYYQAKRVFDVSPSVLIEETSDHLMGNLASKLPMVNKMKEDWLKKLYEADGANSVSLLYNTVENTKYIGRILASVPEFSSYMEENLPMWLISDNEKIQELATEYVYGMYLSTPKTVLNLIQPDWSDAQKERFMIALPLTSTYWTKAQEILSSLALTHYWENKNFDISLFKSVEQIDYAVKQFLHAKQWEKALSLAEETLDSKFPCSVDMIEKVLLETQLETFQESETCWYSVQKLFTYLAEHGVNRGKLFAIAWQWYGVLKDEIDIISDFLAEDYKLFIMILVLLNKPEKSMCFGFESISPAMQEQCIEVLYNWKVVPGYHDGKFDENQFKQWIAGVDKEKERYGVSDIAAINVGKVLFYAANWEDELFLPECIAEFLDDENRVMERDGFFYQAIHSLDAHISDPNGSVERDLAGKYEKKADELDENGYVEFAHLLWRVHDHFLAAADDIKNRFRQGQLP